jgi:hypothetical protein
MKDAAKRDAFNLWLACGTQDEIAEGMKVSQSTVVKQIACFITLSLQGQSNKTDESDDEDGDGQADAPGPFKPTKAELAAADHAATLSRDWPVSASGKLPEAVTDHAATLSRDWPVVKSGNLPDLAPGCPPLRSCCRLFASAFSSGSMVCPSATASVGDASLLRPPFHLGHRH